jgi:predicted HicB family RNase H-like nuclease
MRAMAKRSSGRRTRPRTDGERVAVRMLVRVYRDELEAYRRAAKRAGLSVSEWVRSVLDRAARREGE